MNAIKGLGNQVGRVGAGVTGGVAVPKPPVPPKPPGLVARGPLAGLQSASLASGAPKPTGPVRLAQLPGANMASQFSNAAAPMGAFGSNALGGAANMANMASQFSNVTAPMGALGGNALGRAANVANLANQFSNVAAPLASFGSTALGGVGNTLQSLSGMAGMEQQTANASMLGNFGGNEMQQLANNQMDTTMKGAMINFQMSVVSAFSTIIGKGGQDLDKAVSGQ